MENFKRQFVILLGMPGSGKGTQADLLSRNFDFYHIDTGFIIKKNISDPQTKPWFKAKNAYLKGRLVPTGIIQELISAELEKAIKTQKNIVLDGSPRVLNEAKFIYKELKKYFKKENIKVINLNISPKTTLFRNTHRKICVNCDRPVPYLPEYENIKECPFKDCKGPVEIRLDDKPEVIEQRIKIFQEQTQPVIDFFKNENLLYEIDGERSIEEIFEDIKKVLNLK